VALYVFVGKKYGIKEYPQRNAAHMGNISFSDWLAG
jgi:hypothetical protein